MNLFKLIYIYFKFYYFLTIKITQGKTKEMRRDYLKIMEDKSGARNLLQVPYGQDESVEFIHLFSF